MVANQSCACTSLNFVFDPLLKKCVCNSNSIWINNTCLSCNTSAFKSSGQKVNDISCGCLSNWTWTSGSKCACDSTSISVNSSCRSCKGYNYTNGSANVTACACVSPLVWTAATMNCTCAKGYALLITGNAFRCFACTASGNSTNSTASYVSCSCAANFVWDPTGPGCICPSSNLYIAAASNASSFCINCSAIANGAGKLNSSSCSCSGQYIWLPTTRLCASCSSLGGVSKVNASSCTCSGKKTWSSTLLKCQ